MMMIQQQDLQNPCRQLAYPCPPWCHPAACPARRASLTGLIGWQPMMLLSMGHKLQAVRCSHIARYRAAQALLLARAYRQQMQIWVTPDSASSATDCPSMTCQQLHLVTDSQTLRLPARQSDRCSLSMWAPYLMPITWQMARQWFQYSDQCTTATFFVFTAAATLIWHAGGRASHIADKRLGWPTCSAYTEHLACKQHLVAAAAPRDLTAALHSQP